jgi:hypothetical protein
MIGPALETIIEKVVALDQPFAVATLIDYVLDLNRSDRIIRLVFHLSRPSVERPSRVDDRRLTCHRLSLAHRHHHVRAVVLVGGLL